MAALTARRAKRTFTATTMSLPGTAQTVYEGGRACWDTSTGKVTKATSASGLVPIGYFHGNQADTSTGAGTVIPSGGTVEVHLDRELNAMWMVNDPADPVLAADLGSLVYSVDDQTVGVSNIYGSSVAGRAWRLDALKGVLVEFLAPVS